MKHTWVGIVLGFGFVLNAGIAHAQKSSSRELSEDHINTYFNDYNTLYANKTYKIGKENRTALSAAFPLTVAFLHGDDYVAERHVDILLREVFAPTSNMKSFPRSHFGEYLDLSETALSQNSFARIFQFNTYGSATKVIGPAIGGLYVKNAQGEFQLVKIIVRGTVETRAKLWTTCFLPIFKQELTTIKVPEDLAKYTSFGEMTYQELPRRTLDMLMKHSPKSETGRFQVVLADIFNYAGLRPGNAKLVTIQSWAKEGGMYVFELTEKAVTRMRIAIPILVTAATLAYFYENDNASDKNVQLALNKLHYDCGVKAPPACAVRILEAFDDKTVEAIAKLVPANID